MVHLLKILFSCFFMAILCCSCSFFSRKILVDDIEGYQSETEILFYQENDRQCFNVNMVVDINNNFDGDNDDDKIFFSGKITIIDDEQFVVCKSIGGEINIDSFELFSQEQNPAVYVDMSSQIVDDSAKVVGVVIFHGYSNKNPYIIVPIVDVFERGKAKKIFYSSSNLLPIAKLIIENKRLPIRDKNSSDTKTHQTDYRTN